MGKNKILENKIYDDLETVKKLCPGCSSEVSNLRLCIKYLMLDLESTCRENTYLRKI